MPIIKNILRKGEAKLQNLEKIDVLETERGSLVAGVPNSQFFDISEVPSPIPMGKSYFKIAGSNLLKPEVELRTEIVDANNTPIYHFPLFRRANDKYIRVAMEVYDDIVSGFGKIIVLGELNPNKYNVPSDYQGIYNVKFIGTINFDKLRPNTQPIEFFKQPRITVIEDVRPNFEIESVRSVSNTITGSGVYSPGDGGVISFPTDTGDVTDSEGNPIK